MFHFWTFCYFKDKLIPNAVLFFTNEYIDPDVESDDDDDDEDSDEESEADGMTEEDDDGRPVENPECKQQ